MFLQVFEMLVIKVLKLIYVTNAPDDCFACSAETKGSKN